MKFRYFFEEVRDDQITGQVNALAQKFSEVMLSQLVNPDLLIEDSINEYDAAMENEISFMAYNNKSIVHLNSAND